MTSKRSLKLWNRLGSITSNSPPLSMKNISRMTSNENGNCRTNHKKFRKNSRNVVKFWSTVLPATLKRKQWIWDQTTIEAQSSAKSTKKISSSCNVNTRSKCTSIEASSIYSVEKTKILIWSAEIGSSTWSKNCSYSTLESRSSSWWLQSRRLWERNWTKKGLWWPSGKTKGRNRPYSFQ
jgi:hypothetical protein